MKAFEVRSVIQNLVEVCHLTVWARFGDGTKLLRGGDPGSDSLLAAVTASAERLWDRMIDGEWWGRILDVSLRDPLGRIWVLHFYGPDPRDGALVAAGPVTADGPWSVGQVLELLNLPKRVPARLSFRDLRQGIAPSILDAIRRGDGPAVDHLIATVSDRWPEFDINGNEDRVFGFLGAFLSLCEEAAIHAGLDPLAAESLAEQGIDLFSRGKTAKEAVFRLLPHLPVFAERVARASVQGRSAPIRNLIRFLIGNLHRPLQLSEAAAFVGLSTNYAGTLLKKEVGEGFSTVLRRLRINRAKTLLRSGELTIQEVATLVGYRQANHFARVFQALEGMSPSEFRSSASDFGELDRLAPPPGMVESTG